MKKLMTILLLSVILMSCNTLKHSVKNSSATDKETTVKSDLQTNSTANTQTNLKEKDVEKITETIDTTVSIPEKKITGANSGQTITIDNGDQTIEATYDPKSNIIKVMGTIKTKDVPVYKQKVTERTADKVQDQKKQEDVKQVGTMASKEDLKTDNEKSDTWIHRISGAWWFLLIPLTGLIYLAYRIFKPKLPI